MKSIQKNSEKYKIRNQNSNRIIAANNINTCTCNKL